MSADNKPRKRMTLGQKQRKFAKMVTRLLLYAEMLGYEYSFGHAQRCSTGRNGHDCPVGRKRSLHKEQLAIDIHLFKDGKYLSSTEDHRLLGEFWEYIGGSWGGRFNDGNHYSLEHNGRR